MNTSYALEHINRTNVRNVISSWGFKFQVDHSTASTNIYKLNENIIKVKSVDKYPGVLIVKHYKDINDDDPKITYIRAWDEAAELNLASIL